MSDRTERLGRILMVGCGNMGGAMLRRWLDTGFDPARVTVLKRAPGGVPDGVRVVHDVPDDLTADTLILAMKPQGLQSVAATAVGRLRPHTLISILAGVPEALLAENWPGAAVVRAMPNLPVAIGKGVVALHAADAGSELRDATEALMAPLGLVEWIDDAALFEVVTALAGSGPGFTYRFIDALAAAGATLGLAPAQAERLAVATVNGAGALAAEADVAPAVLAERVASPGGSTRAGLQVLDRAEGLTALMTRTIDAATRRNRELAEVARTGG